MVTDTPAPPPFLITDRLGTPQCRILPYRSLHYLLPSILSAYLSFSIFHNSLFNPTISLLEFCVNKIIRNREHLFKWEETHTHPGGETSRRATTSSSSKRKTHQHGRTSREVNHHLLHEYGRNSCFFSKLALLSKIRLKGPPRTNIEKKKRRYPSSSRRRKDNPTRFGDCSRSIQYHTAK